jgi:hypothetical protein
MAKDTRNIPSAGAAKEGLKKISQRADEVIVAQSKDASNESIQAGNAERMEGLPSSTSAPKDTPAIPDPLRSKPNIEEITPGKEARAAAGNVGTGRVNKTTVLDFGKLPSRPEGGAAPASVNVTNKPDVAINLIDRMKSGMGLPGEEQGHLDRAVALHTRDREIAARTGKTVNGVSPTDAPATPLSVFGGHHHRLAKVMHTFGIGDEEVYKNAASQSGQRLETYVHGLHKIAQEHEDSKRQITHTPKEGALWEHPSTKELIPVAANHPDMPSAFTRTKGKVARVTRDATGAEVVKRSHEGWDSMKVAGGKTVYRQYKPETGIDLVDHMRVQMLSEHGPSKTSRKRGGDIATDIANAVSGVVPRGMKQIGKKKVAKGTLPRISSRPKASTRPHGSSTQPADKKYRYTPTNVEDMAPVLVPKAPKGPKADSGTFPPKAKKGEVLVGSKEPTEIPTFTSTGKGRQFFQPVLPGTGVPKTRSVEVTPAVYEQKSGPLSKEEKRRVLANTRGGAYLGYETQEPSDSQREKAFQEVLSKTGSGEAITTKAVTEKAKESMKPRRTGFLDHEKETVKKAVKNARSVKVSPSVTTTETVPTDTNWKPESNRGQQFALDTTEMTGAQEVKAIAEKGGLASQRSAGTSLVPRAGGKSKAKKDRAAAPKPMEQASLFPDFEVKEGRSNAFYMAGSVQPISEASKTLQGAAAKPFGRQPNNKDFEAEESADSVLDRLKVGPKKKAD